MCIIIYKPNGEQFDDIAMDNGFRMNPHGAGFMAFKDGKFVIEKGFFSLKALRCAIEEFSGRDAICAVHFRWATHGSRNEFNCHPFVVNDSCAIMHNGVFKIEITHPKYSDTWHYAQAMRTSLAKYPKFWLNNEFIRRVSSKIEANKVLLMDNEGTVKIFNEDLGYWLDGCWYSNDLFVYGNWHNLDEANRRWKVERKHKIYIQPFFLTDTHNEGKGWFSCNGCYQLFLKKDEEMVSLRKLRFCPECFKEYEANQYRWKYSFWNKKEEEPVFTPKTGETINVG